MAATDCSSFDLLLAHYEKQTPDIRGLTQYSHSIAQHLSFDFLNSWRLMESLQWLSLSYYLLVNITERYFYGRKVKRILWNRKKLLGFSCAMNFSLQQFSQIFHREIVLDNIHDIEHNPSRHFLSLKYLFLSSPCFIMVRQVPSWIASFNYCLSTLSSTMNMSNLLFMYVYLNNYIVK